MGRFGVIGMMACELTTVLATWLTPPSQSEIASYVLPALTGATVLSLLAWRCARSIAHGYPTTFDA